MVDSVDLVWGGEDSVVVIRTQSTTFIYEQQNTQKFGSDQGTKLGSSINVTAAATPQFYPPYLDSPIHRAFLYAPPLLEAESPIDSSGCRPFLHRLINSSFEMHFELRSPRVENGPESWSRYAGCEMFESMSASVTGVVSRSTMTNVREGRMEILSRRLVKGVND